MAQETTMTQTTFENTYNQFTPKVFSNPIIGKLTVLKDNNGSLWFIGSEVARGLGYADPYAAIRDLVSSSYKMRTQLLGESPSNSRGNPNKTIISEQGLYQLISQSQLDNPQIEEFKKWMFKTIQDMRQYGISMSDQFVDQINQIQDPNVLRQMLIDSQQQNRDCQDQLDAAQPAIHLYNEVANDEYTIPISVIASNYGLSAQALNTILHGLRFHYPCGGGWVLYDPYRSMGLAKTRTRQTEDSIYEFVIGYNEKGRIMIDKLLHDYGLLTEHEKILEANRRMQLQQMPPFQQQPTTINIYYGQPLPGQPGYRPNEATVIGPDGRLYDNQGRLVVITDKDGYPYGYKR